MRELPHGRAHEQAQGHGRAQALPQEPMHEQEPVLSQEPTHEQEPALSQALPQEPTRAPAHAPTRGLVVSLDRGYPLVRTATGERRAQHAICLVKQGDLRAVVGDRVELSEEPGAALAQITAIEPRASVLARRELVESIHEGAGKTKEQILAANFDLVVIVQSLGKQRLDADYLERQLVMANESNGETVVLLTKTDLARHAEDDLATARAVSPAGAVLGMCKTSPKDLDRLRGYFGPGRLGVLLGRSGVGKSTLVNLLAGEQVQAVGSVRAKDSAGRHTTVARRLVDLPGGGAVVDTPGMRALGLLGAARGLARTFPDITGLADACRYRDCTHTHEPHCAVAAAVREGGLAPRRRESYCRLAAEVFDQARPSGNG